MSSDRTPTRLRFAKAINRQIYGFIQGPIENRMAGYSTLYCIGGPWEEAMPNRILCPKCHGQRRTACVACRGTGKTSIVGITIGSCKECAATGRRRCDVCGGVGEVEPANSKDFERLKS